MDGACTNLFTNFRKDSLKQDLLNDTTDSDNPPLFSFNIFCMTFLTQLGDFTVLRQNEVTLEAFNDLKVDQPFDEIK
jgi:hypothetical protein